MHQQNPEVCDATGDRLENGSRAQRKNLRKTVEKNLLQHNTAVNNFGL